MLHVGQQVLAGCHAHGHVLQDHLGSFREGEGGRQQSSGAPRVTYPTARDMEAQVTERKHSTCGLCVEAGTQGTGKLCQADLSVRLWALLRAHVRAVQFSLAVAEHQPVQHVQQTAAKSSTFQISWLKYT